MTGNALTPLALIACTVCVFAAGMVAGYIARTTPADDAGDTLIPPSPADHSPMRTADNRAIERQVQALQRTATPNTRTSR